MEIKILIDGIEREFASLTQPEKREILRAIHPPVNPTYRQAWNAIIDGIGDAA